MVDLLASLFTVTVTTTTTTTTTCFFPIFITVQRNDMSTTPRVTFSRVCGVRARLIIVADQFHFRHVPKYTAVFPPIVVTAAAALLIVLNQQQVTGLIPIGLPIKF